MKKILVIGATGQIGKELVPALRTSYGHVYVGATIHKKRTQPIRLNPFLIFIFIENWNPKSYRSNIFKSPLRLPVPPPRHPVLFYTPISQ